MRGFVSRFTNYLWCGEGNYDNFGRFGPGSVLSNYKLLEGNLCGVCNCCGSVQPLNYVPFFNQVTGAGGLMFRAW